MEQNLLELVLQPLVLLVSSQMLDLLHRLLFQFLYLFQFVGVHRFHFVCFLFDLFVELVAFLVVVVVLQEFVL
jgi:fido (protein-threonine AMPylation protein)